MEALVCKNCGANALVQKYDYMLCPYCDSRFTIPKEKNQSTFINNYQTALSFSEITSPIALDDDVARLLKKCEVDPHNAKKYANLVLDIDPDNEEALKYL